MSGRFVQIELEVMDLQLVIEEILIYIHLVYVYQHVHKLYSNHLYTFQDLNIKQ